MEGEGMMRAQRLIEALAVAGLCVLLVRVAGYLLAG